MMALRRLVIGRPARTRGLKCIRFGTRGAHQIARRYLKELADMQHCLCIDAAAFFHFLDQRRPNANAYGQLRESHILCVAEVPQPGANALVNEIGHSDLPLHQGYISDLQ